ncbi:MAG: DMT family transporter [Synergistaceae bacterium]|nr:DMT family transporter [Synergistaceae bacterium]
MTLSEDRKGSLAVLAAGTMWGAIGAFVAELAAAGSTPALTAFFRMGFGFVAVAIVSAFSGQLWAGRKAMLACAALGLFSHAPFNVCFSASVEANGVALSSVLVYTSAIFTALASRAFFAEAFTRRKIVALIINVIGCALAVTGGDLSGGTFSWTGLLLGLGSGFFYSMIAVVGTVAGRYAGPFTVSTWSYLFASLALLVVTRPPLASVGPKLAWIGFLYGLFGAAIPYLFYYAGLRRVRETSRVPVLASIEPVTATIIGITIYREALGWGNLLGIVLVLASIAMMSAPARQDARS